MGWYLIFYKSLDINITNDNIQIYWKNLSRWKSNLQGHLFIFYVHLWYFIIFYTSENCLHISKSIYIRKTASFEFEFTFVLWYSDTRNMLLSLVFWNTNKFRQKCVSAKLITVGLSTVEFVQVGEISNGSSTRNFEFFRFRIEKNAWNFE